MAKTLYIDTADRNKKIIKLNGNQITTKEDLLVSLDKHLKKARVGLKEIKEITVNRGPGSFTGLRVGVSIVNALNYILGLKKIENLDIPEYGKPPNVTLKR